MIHSQLLTDILKLAESAVPVIAGTEGAKYVETAKAIVGLIETVKPLLDVRDQDRAEVTRMELDATIARVNAHADQTIGRLGGES